MPRIRSSHRHGYTALCGSDPGSRCKSWRRLPMASIVRSSRIRARSPDPKDIPMRLARTSTICPIGSSRGIGCRRSDPAIRGGRRKTFQPRQRRAVSETPTNEAESGQPRVRAPHHAALTGQKPVAAGWLSGHRNKKGGPWGRLVVEARCANQRGQEFTLRRCGQIFRR